MLRIVRKTLKICEHANDHCVTRLPNIQPVLIMDFGAPTNPRDFFVSKNARIFSRKDEKMELSVVRMEVPEGANLILGQSHFIKTAEDLYEVGGEHGARSKIRRGVQ